MERDEIANRIGAGYRTSNVENGEYSYIRAAGGKKALIKALGHPIIHSRIDMRFEDGDFVLLVETKQSFVDEDEEQLKDYLEEEQAIHPGKSVVCMLANTSDDKIRVWKSVIDDEHYLVDETVVDDIEHYKCLFNPNKQNNREKVLKNTYELNELLHKKDIDEKLRSQFVGTTLLYIKDMIARINVSTNEGELMGELKKTWSRMSSVEIRAAIGNTLNRLLDGSDNKTKKVELLKKNVLDDQKVIKLTLESWIEILSAIIVNIYNYIDTNSPEGQDILNLFFIAFNKYTGKADKNQAFTPDHITDFMCKLTEVDRTKKVFDGTCGSGSFLVQAMVKELADCKRGKSDAEAMRLMNAVTSKNIYGVEIEEKAYGLATTNMLIHGDGNSNIRFDSLFKCESFIKEADPDIILMNPPYNAKPIGIPKKYKKTWGKSANGKEDPTKGFVFIHYISDVLKKINDERERDNLPKKEIKLAVLLPVSAAIGTTNIIKHEKQIMLEDNTLDAVFSLPNEVFYPGSSVCVCCMLFTMGRPHKNADGAVKETFFGYYKDDGFKKKKTIGRIEQFDSDGNSKWKSIENRWLSLFRNRTVVDGISATHIVDYNSEWLCEAYMKTDYSKLCEAEFQKTLSNYVAYLVKEGKVYED